MKNGFTLVELLAVIVILAVLALIATPVVLSIIDDAKESAMLRSAEMYLSGVENAVMRENMNSGGNFRPNECTISNGNMMCGSTNVEVEVDGEVPSTGSIVFENGKIKEVTLNYTSGTVVKNEEGNLVYQIEEIEKEEDTNQDETIEKLGGICTYLNNGVAEKTAGAKYSCEVKPGTSYNFYVLTTPDDGAETINLIMDRNICEDGTPATEENPCLVDWGQGVTTDGPVTSMTYLYNATKDWTNISPLNYTYNDREVQNSESGVGYTSFVSSSGVAVITPLSGDGVTIGSETEPLRTRMPIESESNSTELNDDSYLFNNLDTDVIYGYWTLSTVSANIFNDAWYFGYGVLGTLVVGVHQDDVGIGGDYGVRPVITLKF